MAAAFAAELSKFNEVIYGKSLLQFGNFQANGWLDSLHFNHKWLMAPYIDYKQLSFIASFAALPIDRNSLDCIIAPLTLELVPQQRPLVISEIDRVLKPTGYVVLFGINPWSVWGASIKWGKKSCLSEAVEDLYSSFSIKRQFIKLGYKQCAHLSFYYIPPVSHDKTMQKLEFFNEVGKMLWPFPSGFYCLIMQKKHYCPTGLIMQDDAELMASRKASMPVIGNWMHGKQ